MSAAQQRVDETWAIALADLRGRGSVDQAVQPARDRVAGLEADLMAARRGVMQAEEQLARLEEELAVALASGAGQLDERRLTEGRQVVEQARGRASVLDAGLRHARRALAQVEADARASAVVQCRAAQRAAAAVFAAALAPAVAATAQLRAVEEEARRILGDAGALPVLAWPEFVSEAGRRGKLDRWLEEAGAMGVDVNHAPRPVQVPESAAARERAQLADVAASRRPGQVRHVLGGGDPPPASPLPERTEDRLARRRRGESEAGSRGPGLIRRLLSGRPW